MEGEHTTKARNRLAQAGFFMSLLGICGVFVAGPFGASAPRVIISLAFLSLPGIVLSAMGLRRGPRRLATWGLLLGLAGAMYLPTLCLAFLRHS